MTDRAADHVQNGPVTLHRVVQTMLAEGLRTHYQPPQRLSHELFVLLLQIKEQERGAAATPPPRPKRPARRKFSTSEALLPT